MDRVIENKNKFSKKTIWISVVSLIVLLIILQISFGDKSKKLNVDIEKISISTVKNDYFNDYIAVIGTVEPITTIYLDATEGGSRVEEIIIEEGNMVNEGDLIAKLSNTSLILEISNYEANVSRIMNELRQARLQMEQQTLNAQSQILDISYALKRQERTFKNNEILLKSNHISKEEYEYSKELFELSTKKLELLLENQRKDSIFREVQVSSLASSLDRMQKNLVIVKKRLESLDYRAPVSGQLASLNLEIGQVINNGQRIGQINILTSYKLRVEIDEHYIAKVTKGLPGDFEFDKNMYKLKITKVYPDVQSGRFAVDMQFLSDAPKKIRIGQTARIKLQLGDPVMALLVPRGGFYQSTGGQWMYILDESEGFAYKRKIKCGRQNPRFYEILEGLEENERVITSSYDNFGDADKLMLN